MRPLAWLLLIRAAPGEAAVDGGILRRRFGRYVCMYMVGLLVTGTFSFLLLLLEVGGWWWLLTLQFSSLLRGSVEIYNTNF